LFWPTTPPIAAHSHPTQSTPTTPRMPPQLLSGALYTRLVAVWELEKWQALGYLAGKREIPMRNGAAMAVATD